MKKIKITILKIAIYAMLVVVFNCCNYHVERKKSKFKYLITQPKGLEQEQYYSLSEIECLPNGCIRFLQFAYGREDTIMICGSFTVENYH